MPGKNKAPRRAAQILFGAFLAAAGAAFAQDAGQPAGALDAEGRPTTVDLIKNGQIQLVINTPGGMIPRRDENAIRSAAYAHNVCIMTTITGAMAAVEGIKALKEKHVGVRPIQKYKGNVNVVG